MTVTVTLPVGIARDGTIHREAAIGPRRVRHLMAAAKDPAYLADNGTYELCCIAAQIERIGDLPKDQINGELILDMYEEDFNALVEAAAKARQRAGEFRRAPEEAGPGDDADGFCL